jgi:hypothetical protein
MKRALRVLRLALCLTLFPIAFAFLGGADASDAGGNVTVGLVAGALVGGFFGLGFGGVRRKWFDYVFGPEKGDAAFDPRGPSRSP